MAGGRQNLTADTKPLWAFISGTRWTPTSATDGSVEGPCLPGIAVIGCLGTERGKLHLPIPSPAWGTAEDGISVTSIPLGQQDTVSSSLPAAPGAGCVGGFSPVLQGRRGGRAGNVLEAAPAPVAMGPTFSRGDRKPGEG